GSMCVMIRNATGKVPTVIGKPEPLMVNVVREKRGISAEETVIVGDRLYTDIATGRNAGITSVCVISGEATLADIENGTVKPTYTFQDVGAIRDVLMG
ncbi:MAG: HAD hydrolase-like protein, partial [Candidatus Methanomethylophilaceae archaeon]|nr:HAD hydrolase-like protein [Candidatus Methanomethylophilaceae archaeon]